MTVSGTKVKDEIAFGPEITVQKPEVALVDSVGREIACFRGTELKSPLTATLGS